MAGLGLVLLFIYAVLSIAVMLLGIWLTYTIIWRAVRRGLREYYNPTINAAARQRGPRDW